MSADLPAGAVTAAAVAIHKRRCNCAIPHRDGWPGHSRLEYEYAEHALEAAAPDIRKDERAWWAAKLREMAAAVLPQITTHSDLLALAKADRNSPGQAEGRLLLQLADLLEGDTDGK